MTKVPLYIIPHNHHHQVVQELHSASPHGGWSVRTHTAAAHLRITSDALHQALAKTLQAYTRCV